MMGRFFRVSFLRSALCRSPAFKNSSPVRCTLSAIPLRGAKSRSFPEKKPLLMTT